MLTGDRAADITIVTPHTYTHTHTHTYIYIYISHVRIQVFWVSDYWRFRRSLRLLVLGSNGPTHSPTHTTSYSRSSQSPVCRSSVFSLHHPCHCDHDVCLKSEQGDAVCENNRQFFPVINMSDLIYFIDWNIITLSGRCVVVTFKFDWVPLLCIWFVVVVIPSLVVLYCDDYMFGDVNIFRFIVLVFMFVVSIMFSID